MPAALAGTGQTRVLARTGVPGITVLGNEIRLDFTSSGEAVHQRVPIERTRCHYGGMRPWFHCPRCQRRVAVLFLRSAVPAQRPLHVPALRPGGLQQPIR